MARHVLNHHGTTSSSSCDVVTVCYGHGGTCAASIVVSMHRTVGRRHIWKIAKGEDEKLQMTTKNGSPTSWWDGIDGRMTPLVIRKQQWKI